MKKEIKVYPSKIKDINEKELLYVIIRVEGVGQVAINIGEKNFKKIEELLNEN
jgi:hypothetical protein